MCCYFFHSQPIRMSGASAANSSEMFCRYPIALQGYQEGNYCFISRFTTLKPSPLYMAVSLFRPTTFAFSKIW